MGSDQDQSPSSPPSPADVTRLLRAAGAADRAAANELLTLVYDQLRKIAQQRMSEERAGHTLQATALVHEAYLRLVGDQEVWWDSRAHFFAAAAEAMRRILIDHARGRGRQKRAAGLRRVPLSVADLAEKENPEEILALDEAICRMEEQDPKLAALVRMRFYAGLSVADTAQALELSERTVKRHWTFARAWLFEALKERPGE